MTSNPTRPETWLPLNILLGSAASTVRWMDFGTAGLPEPFFTQTVKRLRSTDPPAAQRTTNVEALISAACQLGEVPPSGIVFHISRCGSTLLVNALKTSPGLVVLSEAWPIETLFAPDFLAHAPLTDPDPAVTRRKLANCVTTLYARAAQSASPGLIVKCVPADILQIGLIRNMWPDVPAILVIRDPVEVIVSLLAPPRSGASWSAQRDLSSGVKSGFGLDGSETPEEFCARELGRLCAIAETAVDDRLRIVDYETIDANMILKVAAFFGVDIDCGSDSFRRALTAWSKDPSAKRSFDDDRARKQSAASEVLRNATDRWARDSYRRLKEKQRW